MKDPRIIRSLILALLFGLLLTMIFSVKEGFQKREIGSIDGGQGGHESAVVVALELDLAPTFGAISDPADASVFGALPATAITPPIAAASPAYVAPPRLTQ